MKGGRALCGKIYDTVYVLFSVLALTVHKTQQLFTPYWGTNQYETCWQRNSIMVQKSKQKILHGRGPSNINLGIFVCSFDVCRASQQDPSINYGRTNRDCNSMTLDGPRFETYTFEHVAVHWGKSCFL